MAKIFYVDPSKCTGCRTCELVCSIKNEGVANPVLSRIRVIADKDRGLRVPTLCQQCQDAPCVSVCPVNALKRDNVLGITKLDKDRCIGCKMCISACPFGGIAVNPLSGEIFKCDLCGGDPQCVRFCEDKAIMYLESDVVVMDKKRGALERQAPLFEQYGVRGGIVRVAELATHRPRG
mgnify:CR=1 FL=1